LALRRRGARYELLAAPASLIEGQPATVRTRITNTGPTSWPAGGVAATLAWLPAVPYYDGTNRPGTRLASIPIAEDVPPGGSVELELPFDAPSAASLAATGGAALLKVDLEGATDRFADHGVVPLQMPLLVTSLEPTPTPEPTPTREPTPTSTAGPAQQSGPEPSTEPTPAPSSGPSATLTASPSGGTAPAATPASTPEPIPEPTPTSTAGPAQQSGPEPSAEPTPAPAPEPTPAPTPEPTPAPTPEPTPIPEPTSTPTSGP